MPAHESIMLTLQLQDIQKSFWRSTMPARYVFDLFSLPMTVVREVSYGSIWNGQPLPG